MPYRSSIDDDPNESAFAALQEVIKQTEGTEKDPIAVLLGRRGGLKGGRARAAKLTPARRRQIAKKAAEARWKKAGGVKSDGVGPTSAFT